MVIYVSTREPLVLKGLASAMLSFLEKKKKTIMVWKSFVAFRKHGFCPCIVYFSAKYILDLVEQKINPHGSET